MLNLIQVMIGWYLHNQTDETRDKFKIDDAIVIHANPTQCRIIRVPKWARVTLMKDLHQRFVVKPKMVRLEKAEKRRKTMEAKAHRRIKKEQEAKEKEKRKKERESKKKLKEKEIEKKMKEREKKKKEKVKMAKKKKKK